MGNAEDLISRSAALKSLGEPPPLWQESDYEIGMQVQWTSDFNAIKSVPPAHQDHIADADKKVDLISRQAAIDALENVAELYPWRVPGNRDSYSHYNEGWCDAIGRAEIGIEELPSAQPEDWMERNKERILQAGMEGREIEFRIGGRLFAIREKAQ